MRRCWFRLFCAPGRRMQPFFCSFSYGRQDVYRDDRRDYRDKNRNDDAVHQESLNGVTSVLKVRNALIGEGQIPDFIIEMTGINVFLCSEIVNNGVEIRTTAKISESAAMDINEIGIA